MPQLRSSVDQWQVLVKGETAGPAARKALELLQRHVPIAAAAEA